MEDLRYVYVSAEDEEYIPPQPEVIDGITIIDPKGWGFMQEDPAAKLAKKLAQPIEARIGENDTIAAIWEDDDQALLEHSYAPELFRALILLKKFWLYGEELYAIYKKSN